MKYYKKPKTWNPTYSFTYCRDDSPVYNFCTLFMMDGKGLCVIQQRYDSETKHTWWHTIDPWLANDIYLNENFKAYFAEKATSLNEPRNLPTVTVRQIMRALHMPPLRKEPWETRF